MRSALKVEGASLALVVLGCACSREPPPTDATRALEILAAHHVPDADPSGVWYCDGEYGSTMLHISWIPRDEQFSVLIVSGTDTAGTLEIPGTARLEGGILTLTAREHEFDERLHMCRFGAREFLIPEEGAWFTRGEDPVPYGRLFTRTAIVEAVLDYLPGPDDETRPMRREIGGPGD